MPTEQQFVELLRSYLETLLKTQDLVEEDLVYGGVVLNLRAGNDAVSVVKLDPPYNLMVDLEKVPFGREQPSVLELYNFIIETSDHYSNLCKELEAIRSYEPKDEALVMV